MSQSGNKSKYMEFQEFQRLPMFEWKPCLSLKTWAASRLFRVDNSRWFQTADGLFVVVASGSDARSRTTRRAG